MPTDLAALVGSRICHDLISPIGAIGNGVELLTLTDGCASAEMSLISESVQNANARIRFFRIAFGKADHAQLIGKSEILPLLKALAWNSRFDYVWQVQDPQPRILVRAALLGLLCMVAALPLGGSITITKDGDQWMINAVAKKYLVDTRLWEHMQTADEDIEHTAPNVQFALLPLLLDEAGRRLRYEALDSRLSIVF